MTKVEQKAKGIVREAMVSSVGFGYVKGHPEPSYAPFVARIMDLIREECQQAVNEALADRDADADERL